MLFPILGERRRQPGGVLSGGEQRTLAMGRALLARPHLLVIDETTKGLSPLYVDRMFDIIQELNRDGIGIPLVEQNATIRGAGYVLQGGRIVLHGTAQSLINNPMMRKTVREAEKDTSLC